MAQLNHIAKDTADKVISKIREELLTSDPKLSDEEISARIKFLWYNPTTTKYEAIYYA